MICPNCGSQDIYRNSPHELIVYCDRCRYSWQVTQPKTPLLREKIYQSKGSMKGTHYVSVWYCPIDSTKYSFALTYSTSAQFNEFLEDRYLSGIYDSPQQALEAGIKEVRNN